jgi:hypothetical protein
MRWVMMGLCHLEISQGVQESIQPRPMDWLLQDKITASVVPQPSQITRRGIRVGETNNLAWDLFLDLREVHLRAYVFHLAVVCVNDD